MWTYELLNRSGNVLFVIYHDNETIGSLQFPEDNKEYIELWKLAIDQMNRPPEKLDPNQRS